MPAIETTVPGPGATPAAAEIQFQADTGGCCRALGAGWEEITGVAPAAAVGRRCFDFMHPADVAESQRRLAEVVAGRREYCLHEVRFLHQDGTVRWLEVHARPARDAAGAVLGLVGAMRDVTERHRTVEEAERRAVEIGVLTELASRLVRSEAPAELFPVVLDALHRALPGCRPAILLSERAGSCRLAASKGPSPRLREVVERLLSAAGETAAPDAVIISDTAAARLPPELRALTREEGVGAVTLLPLGSAEAFVGWLLVAFDGPHELAPSELALCRSIAGHLSAALQRAYAVQRATDEARRSDALKRLLELALGASGVDAFLEQALDTVLGLPELGLEPAGAISLVDEATGELVRRAQRNLSPKVLVRCGELQPGEGLGGAVRETGPAAAAAPQRHLGESAPHGHVVAPIAAGSRRLGVLTLYLAGEAMGERRAADFAEVAARTIASALERLQVQEALEQERAVLIENQAARMRSETDFQALIENAVDSVCVHRRGRVAFINPAGVRLLGYADQRELVGQRIDLIVHPADRLSALERVRAVWETGEPSKPTEQRLLRQDGREAVVEVTELRVGFSGEPAIVAMARDLTERRQIAARAMQMDRMIAVGTLATGVAHEINNPLAYVLANLNYVGEALSAGAALGDTEDLRQALADARKGAERVRDIVADLKLLARADSGLESSAMLSDVLESAISIARGEIRHRATLVHRAAGLPAVAGSAGRLGQVFLNLIVNAAQAIPAGDPERHQVRVLGRADAGFVYVDVEDTGSGIAPENLARIFDPFFTTKPVGQGTGLGLSICQGIVKSLSGELSVRSVVGRGSTFTVKLPRAEGGEGTAPAAGREAPAQSGARVLVVDDDLLVGAALRRILSPRYCLTIVSSAAEALTHLEAGERYAAVLCDVMMPNLSGMDLFQRLERLDRAQAERVVFMTAGAFTPEARDFLERVSNPRIGKPFDERELVDVLGPLVAWA